ncbi:MAG: MFS transporter [Oscillospiraceae bacterium]|nr:MFS transporter [Oscillospiraceae bacterium]
MRNGSLKASSYHFAPTYNAMLAAGIENKKTSVWKTGNALKSAQFWLVTIPMGTLLMCAVGMMTQTARIIGSYPGLDFGTVMGMVMIFALIGSYVLGPIDGKFGTKTAITISVVVMLLTGVLGGIGNQTTTMISIILLAVFMGAGSNFTVSAAAQYWRREDFPSVFAVVNPIANIIQSLGPMMVAMTIGISVTVPFWAVAVIAVIALILILCFKPAKVKATDDKYRAAAGKPLDDALVGRK